MKVTEIFTRVINLPLVILCPSLPTWVISQEANGIHLQIILEKWIDSAFLGIVLTSEHHLLEKTWETHKKKVVTASFIFFSVKAWVRACQESAGGTCPAGQRYLSLPQPDPTAGTGQAAVGDAPCQPIPVGAAAKRKMFAWFATGLFSKEASLVRKIQRGVERQIRGENSSPLSCLPLDGNKSADSPFCSFTHLKIVTKLQIVSWMTKRLTL